MTNPIGPERLVMSLPVMEDPVDVANIFQIDRHGQKLSNLKSIRDMFDKGWTLEHVIEILPTEIGLQDLLLILDNDSYFDHDTRSVIGKLLERNILTFTFGAEYVMTNHANPEVWTYDDYMRVVRKYCGFGAYQSAHRIAISASIHFRKNDPEILDSYDLTEVLLYGYHDTISRVILDKDISISWGSRTPSGSSWCDKSTVYSDETMPIKLRAVTKAVKRDANKLYYLGGATSLLPYLDPNFIEGILLPTADQPRQKIIKDAQAIKFTRTIRLEDIAKLLIAYGHDFNGRFIMGSWGASGVWKGNNPMPFTEVRTHKIVGCEQRKVHSVTCKQPVTLDNTDLKNIMEKVRNYILGVDRLTKSYCGHRQNKKMKTCDEVAEGVIFTDYMRRNLNLVCDQADKSGLVEDGRICSKTSTVSEEHSFEDIATAASTKHHPGRNTNVSPTTPQVSNRSDNHEPSYMHDSDNGSDTANEHTNTNLPHEVQSFIDNLFNDYSTSTTCNPTGPIDINYAYKICQEAHFIVVSTKGRFPRMTYHAIVYNVLYKFKDHLKIIKIWLATLPTITTSTSSRKCRTDQTSLNRLPFVIAEHHTPLRIKPDGNCLYRALAQGVLDDQQAYIVFRVMTAYAMLFLYEAEYKYISEQTVLSVEENVKAAVDELEWGSESHMYMASALLERPIYSYGLFPPLAFYDTYNFESFQEDMTDGLFSNNHQYVDFMVAFNKPNNRMHDPILLHHYNVEPKDIPNHFNVIYKDEPTTDSILPAVHLLSFVGQRPALKRN